MNKNKDYKKAGKELQKLKEVVQKLRGPDGCPWDRKRDYYSMRPYIIEEAYEVVEALEKKDRSQLKEELGDLLLQVVFQAQIGEEKGDFSLAEVIKELYYKLMRRHPHVFGDKKITEVSEVKATWENIKKEENTNKNTNSSQSLMDKINREEPALKQAYEIQDKAADVGFDWDYTQDVINKIKEELNEIEEEIKKEDNGYVEDELGDLLFAVVNLSRFYSVDPEIALLKTNLKFKERFKYIEEQVNKSEKDFKDHTLEELDHYWEEAKISFNKK